MKNDGTVFTLENEELLITVDRHGAELTRIYDKKAGRELLWGSRSGSLESPCACTFPVCRKEL